jgi:hypothetical protein
MANEVVVQFNVRAPTFADVSIFDVQGRQLRQLERGQLRSGQYRRSWDYKDDHGELAASGIYFVAAKTLHDVVSKKVFLLR